MIPCPYCDEDAPGSEAMSEHWARRCERAPSFVRSASRVELRVWGSAPGRDPPPAPAGAGTPRKAPAEHAGAPALVGRRVPEAKERPGHPAQPPEPTVAWEDGEEPF